MVTKKSPRKTLSFSVTGKEYSDFWYLAELLGKTKKKEIFLEMIKIVKSTRGV